MIAKRVLLGIILILATVGQTNRHEAADFELPASRELGRAVVINDDIYYFGGGSSKIDIFDPEHGEWSRASLGMSSPQMLGDQIDGQLYVMDVFSRRFLRFDPETKRTHNLPDVPTRRVNGTVIAAAGKLYVIGGYSKDITDENCVEVYDPQTNRWSTGPSLPGYRPLDHFHSAAVLDGKLHVVGGLLEGNKGQPHWRLDDSGWTKRADPPLHAMWKHSVLAAAAGKLYLIAPHPASKENESIKPENNIFAYHPADDQWRPVGRAPKGMPVGLFAQAVVGDRMYILGGYAAKAVFVFDAATEKWE